MDTTENTHKEINNIISKLDGVIEQILVVVVSLVFSDIAIASSIARAIWRIKIPIILGMFSLIIFICSILTSVFFPESALGLANLLEETPESLSNYIEFGFYDNAVPRLTPLGDLENVQITAYFNDINYYKIYHRWHKAIDIIPSVKYLSDNKAYLLTEEPVIFATCSGVAKSLRDGAGANYVYIECSDSRYTVMMVHNQRNFLPIGKQAEVLAGQPIAVMGNTGNSDGAHVHYAVKNRITGEYIDPLNVLE